MMLMPACPESDLSSALPLYTPRSGSLPQLWRQKEPAVCSAQLPNTLYTQLDFDKDLQLTWCVVSQVHAETHYLRWHNPNGFETEELLRMSQVQNLWSVAQGESILLW